MARNLVPLTGDTTATLGTTAKPWHKTITASLEDSAGNAVTPAQLSQAMTDIDAVEASVAQMVQDIAALDAALSAHADATNNPHVTTAAQTGAIPETARGAASGVATLDAAGRLPMSQVPSALLYDLGYFASLSALTTAHETAQPGNHARVAVTDAHDQVYIWDAEYGWIASGGDGLVTSVNGMTGAVLLNAADVGAASATHGHTDATTTTAGFMPGAMVSKLDGIAAQAAAVGSATPLMDGTASAGSSAAAARDDHRHGTDTSRAPLASPALTGNPTAPTQAAGNDSTRIATTAFVAAALAARSIAHEYTARSLETVGADWAVTTPAYIDTVAGLAVRVFADSAESGVGCGPWTIPTGKTQLTITANWAAATSPGSTAGAVYRLHSRTLGGTWDAGTVLATWSTADAAYHEAAQTITLATLGYTAGDTRQFELVRVTAHASDTLTGNALLATLRIEVL